MIIFRFSLLISLFVAGCGQVSRPEPVNELESLIFKGDKKEFQRFVESQPKEKLAADMEKAQFEQFETDSKNCTQYLYDRSIDMMGQSVTAQIFDCEGKLTTDIVYTFL